MSDIVILGKSIGNGYLLVFVVTRFEFVELFVVIGMFYFNIVGLFLVGLWYE